MARLVLEEVSKVFAEASRGSTVTALDHFSLEVWDGEFFVLLGPSGCGKTTLLRVIAGLETPSSGGLTLDGASLADVAPQDRSIGMAFQSPALLPHLTVRQNIELGPKLRGVAAAEAKNRLEELARLTGITGLLERRPETLSGGEQQRASLARALALRPSLLLLDEPLANLDPSSRSELRESIRSVQRALGVTTIYVTHDQAEAAVMADRIAILKGGMVQQVGTAPELYRDPDNLFVAEFFGPDRPNRFSGVIREGTLVADGSEWRQPVAISGERPVRCTLQPAALRPGGGFQGVIKAVQQTGWSSRLSVECSGLELRAEVPFDPRLMVGTGFAYEFERSELLLFDAVSGARIREAKEGRESVS